MEHRLRLRLRLRSEPRPDRIGLGVAPAADDGDDDEAERLAPGPHRSHHIKLRETPSKIQLLVLTRLLISEHLYR